MPDKKYKIGEDIYNIPIGKEKEFLTDNPSAEEIHAYELNGENYNIPISLSKEFAEENKTAKPLGIPVQIPDPYGSWTYDTVKKKDVSESNGNVGGSSSGFSITETYYPEGYKDTQEDLADPNVTHPKGTRFDSMLSQKPALKNIIPISTNELKRDQEEKKLVSSYEEKHKYDNQSIGEENWKALKSSSVRTTGGIVGLPNLVQSTIFEYIEKPILKARGATDIDIDVARYMSKQIPLMGTYTADMSEQAQTKLNEAASKIESTMKQYEGGIIDSIEKGNYSDTFRQLLRGTTQSLPYLAMVAGTSGGGTLSTISTIGSVAASQRYGELNESGLMDGDEQGKVTNAWLYGGFEAAGEVFTASIFRSMKNVLKGYTEEVIKRESQGMAKSFLKEYFGESSSEAVTELGQQITDYVQGNRDSIDLRQVGDAFIQGGVAVAPIAGTTSVVAKIKGSRIAPTKDIGKIQDNVDKIIELQNQVGEVNTETGKQALENEIVSLKETNDKIAETHAQTASTLTDDQYKKAEEITQSIDQYERKIVDKKIDGLDTKIEESVKKTLEKEKEAILTPITDNKTKSEPEVSKEKDRASTEQIDDPKPTFKGKKFTYGILNPIDNTIEKVYNVPQGSKHTTYMSPQVSSKYESGEAVLFGVRDGIVFGGTRDGKALSPEQIGSIESQIDKQNGNTTISKDADVSSGIVEGSATTASTEQSNNDQKTEVKEQVKYDQLLNDEIKKTRKEKLSEKEVVLKDSIAKRLESLSGAKFAIEDGKSKEVATELVNLTKELAELGLVKVEQGVDVVVEKLKEYLPDKDISKYRDDLESAFGDKYSGIKKDLIPQENIEAFQDERGTTSIKDVMAKAKIAVDKGDVNPSEIIRDVNTKPRQLTADETGALIYHKTNLDNRYNDVFDKLEKAKESEDIDGIAENQQQLDIINRSFDEYNEAALNSGYEQGLSFRMRQVLMNSEFNVVTQLRKYKEANKGVVEPEIEKKFTEYDRRLKELDKKIKDLENKKSKSNGDEIIKEIKGSKTSRKRGKDLMAEGFDELMQAIGGKTMAIGDYNPKVTTALSKIGRGMIDEGIATLDNVIKKIEDYVKSKNQDFKIDPYIDDLLEDIKAEKGVKTNKDGSLVISHNLIRDYVEGGVGNIEDLVSGLKKDFGLTQSDREIRDAVTKYGKTINLNKEEIEVKIREMKRIGRLVSGLEDVQKKKRPLRSGLQRDKLTDKERRLQTELKEAMKDIPLTEEELAKSWKTSLDAVKTRLKNQIKDIQHRIDTGEKSPQKKGIQYDQEANDLKEQRDALKSILESIEGKREMSNEQKVRIAISNLEKMADKYEEKIKRGDLSSVNRKSTIPQTPELIAAKERLKDLRSVLKEMRDKAGASEQMRLDKIKSNLNKSIQNYQERIKNKDYSIKKKVKPEMDEEALRLEIERNKIKYLYETEQERARIKNRPRSQKRKELFISLANVSKPLRAMLDFSAVLRQGLILTVSHPKIGAKSFKEMLWQTVSPKRAEEWMDRLRASDIYVSAKRSGLYLSEPTAKLTAQEEMFMTTLSKRIPVLNASIKVKGKMVVPGLGLVDKTERAFVGYLNQLRIDVYNQGTDYLDAIYGNFQKNPEAYKSWAEFINNATGRGKLGKLEPVAGILNGIGFSPRLVASRLNLLYDVITMGKRMPIEVRKMASRDMGIFIGTGMAVLFLAKAMGAEVEDDPRSSDFGKIKLGSLRFDIWAGFQQPIRTFVQFMSGERKSSETGVVSKMTKDRFPYETREAVLGDFLRSKLAPTPGLALNIIKGEDMVGNPVTPKTIVEGLTIPLYLSDISEIYKEEGLSRTSGSAFTALFGIGVQHYKDKDPVRAGIRDGKSLGEIIKEQKYPEEKSWFNTPIYKEKEKKLTDRKEASIEDKYKIYKRFGLDNEDVNFLMQKGMTNEAKALYLYDNRDKKIPISLYKSYGVISKDTYDEYYKLIRKNKKN